jgi:hypothetical protein
MAWTASRRSSTPRNYQSSSGQNSGWVSVHGRYEEYIGFALVVIAIARLHDWMIVPSTRSGYGACRYEYSTSHEIPILTYCKGYPFVRFSKLHRRVCLCHVMSGEDEEPRSTGFTSTICGDV